MRSLYPGACRFGDMRSRFFYIRGMLVTARGNIDRFRATAVLLVEGFIKVMNGLVMTLKEDKRFLFKCLAAHSQYSLPDEALNVMTLNYPNLCPLR